MVRGRQLIAGDEVEEFWALKDVIFEVKRGEVVGIIGRNGAGKVTLLKILSRITEPTEGRVTIKGRVASLLEVGTGFHPELTGRENIFLNGAILGMTRAEISRKFDEIVAFAEVEKFLDTPVKRYSSGMYVRLAFAVAAHLEPEILVVDEVLAVGDAEFQKKCLGKMQDVAGHGRTVLFVSHNMGAIQALCGRVILLRAGGVSYAGPSDAGIEKYLSSSSSAKTAWDWRRPRSLPQSSPRFEEIAVALVGRQPCLRLKCSLVIQISEPSPRTFIAVDISNIASSAIMQALPKAQPFIEGSVGEYSVDVEIELPPLIPGVYAMDFWIGSHHDRTMDLVRQACVFEVTESPLRAEHFHTPVITDGSFQYLQ